MPILTKLNFHMESQATNTSQQVPELSGDASGSNDTRTTGPTSDRVGDSKNNRGGDKKQKTVNNRRKNRKIHHQKRRRKINIRPRERSQRKRRKQKKTKREREREREREGIGDQNPNCKLDRTIEKKTFN